MSRDMAWFVGIDWGTRFHEVCIVDRDGGIVERRHFLHTGAGLSDLAQWLWDRCQADPTCVAVAIEVPHGAVVETLLERGFAVFSLNPKQLDRFRDRFSPAGAKDDRRDAYVLADSLRTDRHCFRRLQVPPADIVRLRELVRTEEELKEEHRRLANRLRDLLHRYYPQMLALAPAADEPWFWELVAQAPEPESGRRLTEAPIEALLRKHRIRRLSAREVVMALQASSLHLAPGSVPAAADHVKLLLPRLQLVRSQSVQVQRQIGELLSSLLETADGEQTDVAPRRGEHRDVAVLLSAPGIGRITAATMLAQACWGLSKRDYHALRAQGGLAPVTRSSGGRRRVAMRRACDTPLRNAFYHMARVASIYDPAAREHYAVLRQGGHTHGRALRGVADRLLRILCAMLRNGELYDPNRHRERHAAAAPAA